MAMKSGDVKAVSKISGILAELSETDRRLVLLFIDGGWFTGRTKAAMRAENILGGLDEPGRERVLKFFLDQTSAKPVASAAPSAEVGSSSSSSSEATKQEPQRLGPSRIRHADGSERAV
jgi:hypothetical protein